MQNFLHNPRITSLLTQMQILPLHSASYHPRSQSMKLGHGLHDLLLAKLTSSLVFYVQPISLCQHAAAPQTSLLSTSHHPKSSSMLLAHHNLLLMKFMSGLVSGSSPHTPAHSKFTRACIPPLKVTSFETRSLWSTFSEISQWLNSYLCSSL